MPITYINRFRMFPPPPPAGDWTDPDDSVDTRKVYVAANGLDSNDGLTTSTPKLTINAGKALLRPGFPDWLLLRQGDTFTNQSFGIWKDIGNTALSGRSPTERMVIGSYNTGTPAARPIVLTGTADGITWSAAGGGTLSYLYILGIAIRPHTYTGSTAQAGIRITSNYSYVHVEDCLLDTCRNAMLFSCTGTSTSTNLIVRRNVVRDCYATGTAFFPGISVTKTNLCLIEENVVDNHQPGAPVASCWAIYTKEECLNVTVRKNIVSRSADRGVAIECGGPVKDNVFIQTGCGIQYGVDPSGVPTIAPGVPVDCTGNLIIEGVTNALSESARGIQFRNISGGLVTGNIITQTAGGSAVLPLYLHGDGWRIRNLSISGNRIFTTGGVLRVNGTNSGTPQISSCSFFNNDLQQPNEQPIVIIQNANIGPNLASSGNRFWGSGSQAGWFSIGAVFGNLAFYKSTVSGDTTSTATQVVYTGAAYTIGSYHGTVGGTATTLGFITACRAQSRLAWDNDLNALAVLAYFRTGYGI